MAFIRPDDTQDNTESKKEIATVAVTADRPLASSEPSSVGSQQPQKSEIGSDPFLVRIFVSEPEIRMRLRAAARGLPTDGDAFFKLFSYTDGLFRGNYSYSLTEGVKLLNRLKQLDKEAYAEVHKGSPFYWLGMAAFLVKDFQTATFFFDSAVSEDIRAGADPVNKSAPALRFIQIEGEQPDQAARALVENMQRRVETAIDDYNKRPGRSADVSDLELVQIRERFLRRAVSDKREWRSLATAFISYFLEWNHRSTLIELQPGQRTDEPFFLHLFKGCVLFESLLKANPKKTPPKSSLEKVLKYLASELGINDWDIHGKSFPAVVSDLSSADNKIQTAVIFAGRIRNTVGHDLGWEADFDRSKFDSLAAMVASSCLHAIASLYR
jgi:hypothetical protein